MDHVARALVEQHAIEEARKVSAEAIAEGDELVGKREAGHPVSLGEPVGGGEGDGLDGVEHPVLLNWVDEVLLG